MPLVTYTMSQENMNNNEEDGVSGYHIFKAYDKGNFTSDSNYEYGFDTFEEAMERAEELKDDCLSNGQPMQHLAIFQNGEAGSDWSWAKEDDDCDDDNEDNMSGYHIFKAYDNDCNDVEDGFDTFEEAMERVEKLKDDNLYNDKTITLLEIFQNGEAESVWSWAWSKETDTVLECQYSYGDSDDEEIIVYA